MKPRNRSQSPEHGGHNRRWVSYSTGGDGGFAKREMVQLRTRAVSGPDLQTQDSQDMLPYLRVRKGTYLASVVSDIQMALGKAKDTEAHTRRVVVHSIAYG